MKINSYNESTKQWYHHLIPQLSDAMPEIMAQNIDLFDAYSLFNEIQSQIMLTLNSFSQLFSMRGNFHIKNLLPISDEN